jgi:hypothetical protein
VANVAMVLIIRVRRSCSRTAVSSFLFIFCILPATCRPVARVTLVPSFRHVLIAVYSALFLAAFLSSLIFILLFLVRLCFALRCPMFCCLFFFCSCFVSLSCTFAVAIVVSFMCARNAVAMAAVTSRSLSHMFALTVVDFLLVCVLGEGGGRVFLLLLSLSLFLSCVLGKLFA